MAKRVVAYNDTQSGGDGRVVLTGPLRFLDIDTDALIFSLPPQGQFKVTNLYVNPQGKLVVEFDDSPAP